ncbi:hypothetical protein [Nocardia ninae]|nr:hypothetical protein [Nocardia ninae]
MAETYSDTPVSAETRTVMMDYGQFYLTGTADTSEELPEVVDRASDHGLYAITAGGNIVVLSPHQYNFAMRVDLELFDRPQHPDRTDWQVVLDETTTIDDRAQLWITSATSTSDVPIAIAPGTYHIEISGRGLRFVGQPDSTMPGDVWRVRMWPADEHAEYPPPQRWP